MDTCAANWKTVAHYTDKVIAIETKGAKLAGKGQKLSKAENEKLDRNYAKLEVTEKTYNDVTKHA